MAKRYDAPDSPRSVGRTRSHTLRLADAENPLALEAGGSLAQLDIEYETYGEPNAARDNVILICHALSGDAHAAGWDLDWDRPGRHYRERKPGWWDSVIGPGKALDTNRWYLICANVPGSCYGSTGPASVDPATGKPYGLRFPVVTVADWVRTQAMLLDRLGIERLHAVIGGSLGGQQALEWALAYPERVRKAIVLAASAKLSAQGLAFNAVGRYSILHDPAFGDGDYYDHEGPAHGLAAARMLAHITYLSEEGMTVKFGREPQDPGRKDRQDFGFGPEFAVESYLNYQGQAFVERFDANAYLYITRAMDYYDAAARWGGEESDITQAMSRVKSDMLIASFSTDWLYTPDQTRELALALTKNGRPVTYVDVPSHYGHDAFLVETQAVSRMLVGFLNA